MVNHGRSGGCVTCKLRRVKCDEAKPECRSCKRLQLRCGGYKASPLTLKFKDQNHKFCTAIFPAHAIGSGRDPAVPSPRSLLEPDTAVPFFLGHYASMGRDRESARGFFEMLVPLYYSERQGSALSLAVLAVASEILYVWRHDARSFQASRKSYTQAVVCLRGALHDEIERGKPATVLAVLTLQLYENIAAVYKLRSATPVHHNGAVCLLLFADSDPADSVVNAYIRRFILHIEISSAMRQKRSLQSIAYSWIGSNQLAAAPDNPSAALDAIGVKITEFQATYLQLTKQDSPRPLSLRVLSKWAAEAKHLDAQLLAWAQCVPDHWHPLKLTSGKDMDPSIPTYGSVCEVYPSCQVSNIWNLWRSQRLLLAKIALDSLDTIFCQSQSQLDRDEISARVDDITEYKNILQEMVDSVCHSVPFYLGNRKTSLSLAVFVDPAVLLPSYHSLASLDKERINKRSHDSKMIPRHEHKHHMLARGPWHMLSILSHLLTLFSEENGPQIASFLNPGQLDWIRNQFLRVTTLLHLPPEHSENWKERNDLLNSSTQISPDSKADYLAKRARKGAMFLSGL